MVYLKLKGRMRPAGRTLAMSVLRITYLKDVFDSFSPFSSTGLTLEEFDLEEEKETEAAVPAVTIEDLRARQMRELRELQVCF